MEKICPICNALEEINQKCPFCGSEMIDGGVLQNYVGPYSPYMEADTIPLNINSSKGCTHLIYCPNCNFDTRSAWELVII